MSKIIAGLVAIVLLTGVGFSSNVFASSWDGNPLERLDQQKGVNTSYDLDYNKHKNFAQKAYGWQFSKVCGLDLCDGKTNESKITSFLQNNESQPINNDVDTLIERALRAEEGIDDGTA